MTKMFGQKGYKRMEANVGKSHLLASYYKNCSAKTEDFSIKNSIEEKLIGVKFDFHLCLENLISSFLQERHMIWI